MKRRGFTIVELLVVIGIIGILAAASLIGLSRQQAKARDARRVSDIHKINTGLQSYIADHVEPATPDTYGSSCTGGHRVCFNGWDISSMPANNPTGQAEFMLFLAPYIDGAMPLDPINNATSDQVGLNNQFAYRYIYYKTCPDTTKGTCYSLQGGSETNPSLASLGISQNQVLLPAAH